MRFRREEKKILSPLEEERSRIGRRHNGGVLTTCLARREGPKEGSNLLQKTESLKCPDASNKELGTFFESHQGSA
ncbi:unnamed protein product [Strongylus vulgaris]|uniref:Uncharacterized protein n=1 Tax=Strongylus vulgaris TaxID=40348 RepID=A0A3P7LQ36_STRVU|nr:unnamed protein product [Strongylus vulgaris]